MRKEFCDKCGEHIKDFTLGNRVTMPDDKGADLCCDCRSNLLELVKKWWPARWVA